MTNGRIIRTNTRIPAHIQTNIFTVNNYDYSNSLHLLQSSVFACSNLPNTTSILLNEYPAILRRKSTKLQRQSDSNCSRLLV